MAAPFFEIQREAARLLELTLAQTRAQFGDHVARAFQLAGREFAAALDFNAKLATELRLRAQAAGRRSPWENPR